jgi:hypothetical protein
MWGDPNVSKKLLLGNSQTPWGTGGFPVTQQILRGDILCDLVMQTVATPVYTPGTGSIAADVNGPFNTYSLITAGPSNSAKFYQTSSWSNYLVNLIKQEENSYRNFTSNALAVNNQASINELYTGSQTTGVVPWRFSQLIPISQYVASLGGEVGMWQLAEQSLNLTVTFTPASASAASPYNVFSLTAGQQPYLITGNATVTMANPTVDLLRVLYKNPFDPKDAPPFDFVSLWTQDTFTNPLGLTPSYTFPANSGLLCRAIIDTLDAGTGNGGLVSTYWNAADSFKIRYGTSDIKESMSGPELREWNQLNFGFEPPVGTFFFDWLSGQRLTLQDTLNTAVLLNSRIELTQAAALPANSRMNVIYQLLQPIVG